MRPLFISSYIKFNLGATSQDVQKLNKIKLAYQQITSDTPDVSIVIPAYNEESTIVQTLSSLCHNYTRRKVEIIVVDNNSADRTAELVKACGVRYHLETVQGITSARNAGLTMARGKYVLNADADTLYPKDWIELMVKPLADDAANVAITYGSFSFIPIGSTSRLTYIIYEYLADLSRMYNKYFKDEAVNVYGFNSGFRREQGLAVESFNHPAGTNEDGYLALKLRERGFGNLYKVNHPKAIVWTTDRRILLDGGLLKGTVKRLKRLFNV